LLDNITAGRVMDKEPAYDYEEDREKEENDKK
jgi:hypothetical protein